MQRVLLVMDTLDGDGSVLASALRVDGCEVIVANSPEDVRTALDQGPIALAIIDLMLRGTNGIELSRDLKNARPGLRVMLTSAYHLSERQLERADCGVSGFIPKPYDVAEVVSFIRAKLSGPPSSRRTWAAEPSSAVLPRPEPSDAAAGEAQDARKTAFSPEGRKP